jgi:protein-disulfide isomerase
MGTQMKLKWDAILTATLVACALITTTVVIRREFIASRAAAQEATQKPQFIEDWRPLRDQGVQLGMSDAPVQLIEFADFECPFCGSFHTQLRTLRERYTTQVSLTYIHFPLPGHRFALPAARAAECAGNQGRFEAMYDRLFDEQDSFGLKPWSDYATAAGVPDLATFDACIKKSDPIRRVEQGREYGTKLEIRATPTLIINGWRLARPPSAEELDAMVKAVLAGKGPVPGARKS